MSLKRNINGVWFPDPDAVGADLNNPPRQSAVPPKRCQHHYDKVGEKTYIDGGRYVMVCRHCLDRQEVRA